MGDLLRKLGLNGPETVAPNASMVPTAAPVPPVAPGIEGMPIPPVGSNENPEAVSVMVDPWKPRKQTFLGALADGYLMSQGMKPAYSIARDQRNVQEAMQGYGSDPEAAIARLNRIRGHQADAMELYDKLRDDKRADVNAGMLADIRKERFYGVLKSMMYGLTPKNYQTMLPKLRAYQAKHELDDIELPDEWDDTISAYTRSGMTVDQQADNDRSESQFTRREGRASSQFQQREGRMASQFATSQAGIESRFVRGQDRADARKKMGALGKSQEAAAINNMKDGEVKWDKGTPAQSNYGIKRVGNSLVYFKKVGPDRWQKVPNPFDKAKK